MKFAPAALSLALLCSLYGPVMAQTGAAEADAAAGETLYARACAQCHGRTGRGMASFPSLEDLDAETVTARLEAYRAGESVGPNSALMKPVAKRLSDEEIADLAAFVSQGFR